MPGERYKPKDRDYWIKLYERDLMVENIGEFLVYEETLKVLPDPE